MTTEDPRMPDYYGTGRQPKNGRSYVGLAAALLVVLLAANVIPFVIPHLQEKPEVAERSALTEQKSLMLRPENGQQEQTAICGMLICDLEDTQRRYWDLPNGVIVGQVDENGTSAHAGILPGDVILRIGSDQPDSVQDCIALLTACSDGEKVQMEIYRGGEEIRIELTYRED